MVPGYGMKKELIFPPNSVEATQPATTKRRRLVAKDLGKLSNLTL